MRGRFEGGGAAGKDSLTIGELIHKNNLFGLYQSSVDTKCRHTSNYINLRSKHSSKDITNGLLESL